MPHATMVHQTGDDPDDILIQQVLNAPATEDTFGLNRELEPGEKAEDAEDYEDISDDDLADDEDAEGARRSEIGQEYHTGNPFRSLEVFPQNVDLSALITGNSLEDSAYDDDLFGESLSSPMEKDTGLGQTHTGRDRDDLSDFDNSASPQAETMPLPASPLSRGVDALEKSASRQKVLNYRESPPSKELQRQQELLAMSSNGATNIDGLPAPPENCEELLASLWPKFERDTVPKFMDLLPPKRARYLGKTIPKPPKAVNPTKCNLELAMDQEKSFRISSIPNKPNVEEDSSQRIVTIQEDVDLQKDIEEDVDMESDFENEMVGGISWRDMQMICEDWDTSNAAEPLGSERGSPRSRRASKPNAHEDLDPAFDSDDDHGWPSAKVSTVNHVTEEYAHIARSDGNWTF